MAISYVLSDGHNSIKLVLPFRSHSEDYHSPVSTSLFPAQAPPLSIKLGTLAAPRRIPADPTIPYTKIPDQTLTIPPAPHARTRPTDQYPALPWDVHQ